MPVIELTDLSRPELDVYARLTENQLKNRRHPENALFIAEGVKVIDHALDAGIVPASLLMERRHLAGKAAALVSRCGNVPVYTGEDGLLSSLTGYALSRGVLCAMRRPPLPSAEAVCQNARRLAVLEGISDAANVGAILRSAAALGVDGVLLSPTCCDPLNRRAVRVSMGSVFQVPWTYLEGWPEPGLSLLKSQGFSTVALALTENSVPIDDPKLAEAERLALVLGAEGDGLSPATVAQCDYTARIPMGHGVDSLNVAAAGAVAFWELRVK